MAAVVDRIYQASPVWIQQALVATYGAWWFKRRFGSEFHRLVQEFDARTGASADEFRAYQQQQLGRLFERAARSEHYAPLVASIDRGDPLAALSQLPFLSKETLRTSSRRLLTEHPPRGTQVFRSSGTTGTPSEIYYSREFHALEVAIPEVRSLHWIGVTYRDRRVMFGARKVCRWDQPKPPFWRTSPVENMTYCSIYHLSNSNMRAYVEFLRTYRPVIVMGYPSALVTIARFALDAGLELPPARGVVTTSETVTAEGRITMERAWGSKVWDRYGAVEGCMFASQCESGRYHVAPDVGIIEVVDAAGRPCAPGVIGEVVATG